MRWRTLIAFLPVALAAGPEVIEGPALPIVADKAVYSRDDSIVIHDQLQSRLSHSGDGGRSWVAVDLGQVRYVWPSKDTDGTVYALTDSGFAVSTDGGANWAADSSVKLTGELALANVVAAPGGSVATVFNFVGRSPLLFRPEGAAVLEGAEYCVPHASTSAVLCRKPDGSLAQYSPGKEWQPVKFGKETYEAVEMVSTKSGFFVVIARSRENNLVRLLTSKTGADWTIAKFGPGHLDWLPAHPSGKSAVIMDLSEHSVHVVVVQKDAPAGDLWTSNGSGEFFTVQLQHVRLTDDQPDIVSVDTLPGALIANVFKEVYKHHHNTVASVSTVMSFNDGRSWNALPASSAKKPDDGHMHLHAMLSQTGTSHTLSSPVGILTAMGNTGHHLRSPEEASLCVSMDGGSHWSSTGIPDKDLFFASAAAGSILAAVSRTSGKVYFWLDNGMPAWEQASLDAMPDVADMFAAPDKPQFLVVDRSGKTAVLDFGRLFSDGACDAASTSTVSRGCFLGSRYDFTQVQADCYLTEAARTLGQPCSCVDSDYECDDGFVLEDGHCKPGPVLAERLRTCHKGSSVHLSGGYRLIPGNECAVVDRSLQHKVIYDCDSQDFKVMDTVTSTSFELDGRLENYVYLKTGDNRDEETVLAWTTSGQLVISHDQGEQWQAFPHGSVEKVFFNPYFNDYVLVYTKSRDLYASVDRAVTFKKLNVPGPINLFGQPFQFHPTEGSWMIASVVPENCDSFESCLPTAYATLNFGQNWQKLGDEMNGCAFVGGLQYATDKTLVFCEQRRDGQFNFVSTTDWFKTTTVNVENTFGFALDQSFLITVAGDAEGIIRPLVSVDGRTFAVARIPPDIILDKMTGYTVIDTLTKSVFLAVTTNSRHNQEMSTLLKSNANGTEYVAALPDVNQNHLGLIDFEKIRSTEGVALANVVANADDIRRQGERKILRSVISHSDGALWDAVPAPESECRGKSRQECSLHLHSFTERPDGRNTPHSPSAVGLIIGNGNSGDSLLPIQDAATYFSRDAGVSFQRVSDHPSFWEYGDSGSVIVLVPRGEPTNTLRYTLNEGKDWLDFQFSDAMVQVLQVANIPSDTSRRFLLFVQPPKSDGQNTVAVQVSFQGVTDRQCVYEGPNSDKDDFELWVPPHPQTQSDCLLGHVAQYYRKIPDRNCYVGKIGKKLGEPKRILKNCKCTREDYECDFNYVRSIDGSCVPVKDSEPLDMEAQCAVDGAIAWHKVTGYRKIPIDTCSGGETLDGGDDRPCPGKEAEFEQKYGRRPGQSPGGSNPGGPSVLRITVSVLFVLFVIGTLAIVLTYKFRNQGRIYLGEFEEPTTPIDKIAVTVVTVAANAGQQLLRVWDALIGRLDSRFRSSHINLYERLDSEERSRILGDGLDDDDLAEDLDNPELDGGRLDLDDSE